MRFRGSWKLEIAWRSVDSGGAPEDSNEGKPGNWENGIWLVQAECRGSTDANNSKLFEVLFVCKSDTRHARIRSQFPRFPVSPQKLFEMCTDPELQGEGKIPIAWKRASKWPAV